MYMKFSMHLRTASPKYLRKVDEIVIEYRDRKVIMDCAKKYPQAWYVLEITPGTLWELDEIKEAYILSKERLTICVPDIRDPRIYDLKEANIPFFWGFTVTSFWELQAVMDIGVSEVRIGAPIFFECNKLQTFDIPKRIKANLAHEGYLPSINGAIGAWIRPEDVDFYEDTFQIVEFAGCQEQQEEALFRIYAEQKHWPGRVDMIIQNIQTEAYNRMILEEFAIARKNCGQQCMAGAECKICYRILNLAQPDKIKEYVSAEKSQLVEEEKHS